MPIVGRVDVIKAQIGESLRAIDWVGLPLSDEGVRDVATAALAGYDIIIKNVEAMPSGFQDTHRLVWQPTSGGRFVDQYFTVPSAMK